MLVGGRVSPALSGRISGEWGERPSVDESIVSEGYSLEREASPAPDGSFDWPSGEAIEHGHGHGHRPAPFAAEVVIKGWQVVGGKSWDDSAKVGAYVVYEIEIALRSGTTVLIMRRYTEFHLRRTIPPLPGKNHMHKLSPEFLQDRRPRLQRFLRTVALHPEMGQGDGAFSRWVLASGSTPETARLTRRRYSPLLDCYRPNPNADPNKITISPVPGRKPQARHSDT
ncbi:hypothetical protein CcaverHIS631_0703830 [Cutaneotrichosporon cavernicola]|nr:hypothetical protein CcaverHIS631_0703830 [Cutaneotrichosporon cavernicola]